MASMNIVPFIIIGAIVIFAFIILVKNILAPKRAAQLATLYKQNKVGQATKLAKQLLVKDPRNVDAHYYLALCYLADSKPEIALMELKAIDQIGLFEGMISEVVFRNTIGDLYLRFNQYEEAQKEYLLLIQQEPDNPHYYYLAGKMFELRDHAEKAVKYYRKTIELDRRHADAHARLGNILFRAKHHAEAKTVLEQALQLQPGNALACFYLGKIAKDNKDFKAAISNFEKALKDNELKGKALLERGSCFLAMGDNVRAEAELERAVKLGGSEDSNEVLFSRYLLAHLYEQQRKIDEAIAQWEAIAARKPGFRDVGAKLAEYQDLRADDKMKDYLTASNDEFANICKKAVETMGQTVQDMKEIPDGLEIIAGESSAKWRNTKKLPTIYQFLRLTETIEELRVRTFYESIKSNQVRKGVIVVSSVFSRGARDYAESRPIDLLDKEKLQKLLEGKASSGNQ